MKQITRLFSLAVLVSATLFYSGCGSSGGDEDSEEKIQLEKLKSTWTIQSVVNDGTDRSVEYPGMTLTISGTFSEGGTYNYTSDATTWPNLSPWKAIDTWKFSPGSVTSIIVRQSDLIEMNYSLSNGEKTLAISFNYPDSGTGFNNGRTQKTAGDWTFTFTRP